MALQLINNIIAKFESSVSAPIDYKVRKIPLSSLQHIQSSADLINDIQDEFAKYKFLILTNDEDYHTSSNTNYIDLIHKTTSMSLDFFSSTPQQIKDKLAEPKPGYMSTTAKEFFDYRLVNDLFKNEYYEQLICSQHKSIAKYQSILNETFVYLESITLDIINVLCCNNKMNGIINTGSDLKKFGAIHKPTDKTQKLSASKLSIFHYYNNPKHSECVNCAEHIDQGFLSLEPVANVSGLEIEYRMNEKNEWIRIDDERWQLNENDLILFCGETFQRLSGGKYQAAMHRVGKNDKERLSIVYKLKHRSMDTDMKLHFGDDETYNFYQYDKNGNLVRLDSN